LALAENCESLIPENPHQPAAKWACVFEPRRIPSWSQPAVFDGIAGSFGTAEKPACDEMRQPPATLCAAPLGLETLAANPPFPAHGFAATPSGWANLFRASGAGMVVRPSALPALGASV
jgi:hypothetical protein